MKDGEIIVTKGNRKYRNFGKKKLLLISDLQAEDSGIYECAISPNSTEKGRAELWSKDCSIFILYLPPSIVKVS